MARTWKCEELAVKLVGSKRRVHANQTVKVNRKELNP